MICKGPLFPCDCSSLHTCLCVVLACRSTPVHCIVLSSYAWTMGKWSTAFHGKRVPSLRSASGTSAYMIQSMPVLTYLCPRSACHLSHPPVPGPRQQPDRRAILEVLLTLAAYVRHKGATFGLLQMAIVTAVRSVGGQWGLVTLGGVVKANVVNDPLWQEPQLSLINAFFLVVPRVVIGLLRVLFFTAARAVLILLELCTLRDANIGGALTTPRRRPLLTTRARHLWAVMVQSVQW